MKFEAERNGDAGEDGECSENVKGPAAAPADVVADILGAT